MLSKKRPVKLFPSMAGMLDGAIHPISPNPITLKSLRSQSLSKQVNLPPQAPASLKGFLAVTPDFRNPEERRVFIGGDDIQVAVPPRPTTVDGLTKVAAIFWRMVEG